MMTFRTIPPSYTTDFRITLEPLEHFSDRISVLRSDTVEVFRLELIFPFGLLHAPDIQTGHFLPRLIAMGTADRTAYQVAEAFERLGGFLDISMGLRRTTVTLHGLSRYFKAYLPLLADVIFQPEFPEVEIEIQRAQASQTYLVESRKPAFRANASFKEVIYGPGSLAGQTQDPAAMAELNRHSLKKFHAATFGVSSFDIYLCGHITDSDLSSLKNFSESVSPGATEAALPEAHFPEKQPSQHIRVEMENAVQSSLIIGKRLFNRAHPDFFRFLVTNTTFGGYFGSRLMKNIREEKGLTYGISSSLVANGPDGVFSIRAELNKEKLEEALAAIESEKETLRTTPVAESELATVKNYIRGNILSGTNTLFDIMDKHKAIHYEALPPDFYESMGAHIDAVTPEDVMHMTGTWLNEFSTVIAG
ncbi:MAG: insulinase family protein [Leadbetterella sp.]|nr:insulinase family protein [Leadbetterella sp.]